ncbi:unnamed protein product [Cunninghamella echinulata]
MPAPVEYNPVRRMSTITIPNHDISFDYDFQLCKPQTDIKNAFESKELEASYCRDFACCGLILNDLHDLLQHYEECHVTVDDEEEIDDEEEDFYLTNEDDDLEDKMLLGQEVIIHGERHEDEDDDIHQLKRKAVAFLSDLYQQQQQPLLSSLDSQHDDDDDDDDEQDNDDICIGKKRSFHQSNAVDLFTQSAVKKLALATNMIQPTCFSDEDFLAHAGALLASTHSTLNADKPYKCPVQGCDKAYKNPNGLKYHNQHGHCNLVTDENENVASKPYQCTIGDCGKRYKNLNGLKYHIEHSHVAALNQTLASFGSSFFQPTPELTPSSSPEISCLSPMF